MDIPNNQLFLLPVLVREHFFVASFPFLFYKILKYNQEIVRLSIKICPKTNFYEEPSNHLQNFCPYFHFLKLSQLFLSLTGQKQLRQHQAVKSNLLYIY